MRKLFATLLTSIIIISYLNACSEIKTYPKGEINPTYSSWDDRIYADRSFVVKFISNPSSAAVFIDGDYKGTTPLEIKFGGEVWNRKLEIRKTGYNLIQETIHITKADTFAFNLDLNNNSKRTMISKPNLQRTNNLQAKISAAKVTPESNFTNTFDTGGIASIEIEILKTNMKKPNAVAVVIGNRNYSHKDIRNVEYAHNDAIAIKTYLIDTMGYKEGNIIFETDTTKAQLEMLFGTHDNYRGMLYNYIKPKKSEVFVYYSGHGSPDPTTNRAYLVPTDSNPVMMALTGYPLDVLYGNLPKIEAQSITVVLDACFSGGTNSGKWLVLNASPALLKINNPVTTQNNITIMASTERGQISSWYPEKQHSMFTYFFLKAVAGNADSNYDNRITYKEIFEFVSDRAEGVPYYAKRLHGGRIQIPVMLSFNEDIVFVKY